MGEIELCDLIEKIPFLDDLDISHCEIEEDKQNAPTKKRKKNKSLLSLSLPHAKISNKSLSSLLSLTPKLLSLNISNIPLDENSMTSVCQLERIESLNISYTSESALAHSFLSLQLSNNEKLFKNLVHLNLSQNPFITDQVMEMIVKRATLLNTLHLSNCILLTDSTVSCLQESSSPIILLSVTATQITKKKALELFSKRPHLLIHCTNSWDNRGVLSFISAERGSEQN